MKPLENNKSLPTLCAEDKCTGCGACYNACTHKAIEMRENRFGELHPYIIEDNCVGCKLCEKVCPELPSLSIKRNGVPEVYSCWLKDAGNRKLSTSGGVAYAISCAVIEQGGHVWGAAFDENMYCQYVEANTLDELRPIQRSKYVQSAVGDSFKKIKKELLRGDLVLFAGTGCHVKGLRSYLQKEYPNLFTMDLVCHGVPGHGIWRKYKEWLETKYKDKLAGFAFRPKRKDGQELGYYTLATFKERGDIKMQLNKNGYFVGYQHNIFLRDNCHHCTSNGECRYSDFTVADFWGLGKVQPFKDNMQRTYGISMLALNSDKSKSFFGNFADKLIYEKRSYKEASFSNTQYYKPAIPSPRREAFKKEMFEKSWEDLTAKYLKYTMKEVVLYGIKRFTPPHLLSHAKSLAKWIK